MSSDARLDLLGRRMVKQGRVMPRRLILGGVSTQNRTLRGNERMLSSIRYTILLYAIGFASPVWAVSIYDVIEKLLFAIVIDGQDKFLVACLFQGLEDLI